MSRLTRLILAIWPFVLVAVVALSAISLPRTVNLFKKISTDPADLLPADHPNVETLFTVRSKLEKGAQVTFVFESDDPEATRRLIEDTAAQLAKNPLVGKVFTKKRGYDFLERHKLLYASLDDLRRIRDRLERRIQIEKLGGFYVDLSDGEEDLSFDDLKKKYTDNAAVKSSDSPYHVSEDGKIYSIFVEMKGADTGLQEARVFQDAMTAFAKSLDPKRYHPSMKVYFSGASKVIEYRALMSDLKKVGIIAGILLFIPLLLRFRNPFHVGLIFLPLALGLPISLAFASLFVPKLTISTSFLFSILGGLGIESGIHIFTRYYEMKRVGRSLPHILDDIYGHLGRSILTSVASVAVTFLLLVALEFRGFSEFGLIAGAGLWVLFLIYFSFFPALLILVEKLGWLRLGSVPTPAPSRFRIAPAYFRPLFILFIVFSAYSLVKAPGLSFEFDSKKIRADIPEVREARAKQRMTVTQVNNPAVVLVQSKTEAEALKKVITDKLDRHDPTLTIDSTNSYYDLVPPDQPEKMTVLADIKRLLSDPALKLVKGEKRADLDRFKDTVTKTEPFAEADLPDEIVAPLSGKAEVPGDLFFIRALPKLELDDGRNAMRFAEDVMHVRAGGKDYYPSSDAVVYGLVLKTMLGDAWKVMVISFFSVAFFVFLDFRNLKKTAVVMLPIALGVLWLFGVMAIFGVKFNFYNMIIVPAVMGMSIDNSIHIFHRYQELGRGSVAKVLSSTGVAAMLASLTNASGFFGLLFCVHRGLYSIGLLAVIGVATCFVSTLVFLPLLLEQMERWKKTPAI